MTYSIEVTKLRRQIDRLDHEIFEKILELNKAYQHLKQKIKPNESYNPFVNSEVEKLAQQKNLDAKVVSKIFKEILQLIDEQEVTPH